MPSTAGGFRARRWEWSERRRRLTFHLETAVRWHDGRPTTSRDVVWTLSRDSTGMAVRFVTDATSIWARWTVQNALAKPHMAATGVLAHPQEAAGEVVLACLGLERSLAQQRPPVTHQHGPRGRRRVVVPAAAAVGALDRPLFVALGKLRGAGGTEPEGLRHRGREDCARRPPSASS